MELNTREWAILFWIGAFIVFALRNRRVRHSAMGVVRAFFQWKLQLSLGLALLWSAGCIWMLAQVGWWEWRNLKTSIIWMLTFMFVTMLDVRKLEKGTVALRELAVQTLVGTIFVTIIAFVADFYTMPIGVELILVPVLFLLGGLVVVARLNPEHRVLIGPIQRVRAVVGLSILGFSLYKIAGHIGEFVSLPTVREFAVPILLSIMFLPFLYLLMIVMVHEQARIQLDYAATDRRVRRYAYWRGVLAFGGSIMLFKRYIRALRSSEAVDYARVREAIGEVRRIRRREKQPPMVDWSEGWSPYEAARFLLGHGLSTEDYHRTVVDWFAASPAVEIGGEFFKDRLTYRISGTENAVTRLSLELNANLPGTPEVADAIYRRTVLDLIKEALGDETAGRVEALILDDQGQLNAGTVRINWDHDTWGIGPRGGYVRRLDITHPAYCDPYGV